MSDVPQGGWGGRWGWPSSGARALPAGHEWEVGGAGTGGSSGVWCGSHLCTVRPASCLAYVLDFPPRKMGLIKAPTFGVFL